MARTEISNKDQALSQLIKLSELTSVYPIQAPPEAIREYHSTVSALIAFIANLPRED